MHSSVTVQVINALPGGFSISVNDPANALAIVPDVFEMSQPIAAKLVHDAGLVSSFTGASQRNSWVFSQSPTAGSVVAEGSTVHMVLHSGPMP